MSHSNTRNEKELKKAEERGDLDKSRNFSGKSAASNKDDDGEWKNENRVENAFINDGSKDKTTGKEIGLVAPPEVSVSPTSSDSADKNDKNWRKEEKQLIVDNAFVQINGDKSLNLNDHPFLALKRDQGIFIASRQGLTTDDLLEQINKDLYGLRQFTGEREKDRNGDGILETVIIEERKRNDDGTIQLMNGKPVVGALQQNLPKLLHSRNFVAFPIVKDSKMSDSATAPEDGVLVVRVI